MDNYLQNKVDQSLRLLESAGKRGVVEVAYSGGKGTWERNPYVLAYNFELVTDCHRLIE